VKRYSNPHGAMQEDESGEYVRAEESGALDRARLEWWIKNGSNLRLQGNDKVGWSIMDCGSGLTFLIRGAPSFRTAIDEAMSNAFHRGIRK
jgi:hypothetical protein